MSADYVYLGYWRTVLTHKVKKQNKTVTVTAGQMGPSTGILRG